MDNDIKKLLEENLRLTEENHSMLRKIRGVQKRAVFFKVVYWLVIFGIAFGVFIYVKPIVQKAIGAFGGVFSSLNSLQDLGKGGVPDLSNVSKLLNQVKK